MKKNVAALAALALLAALGATLNAENFSSKAAGVTLWLPDNWKIDSNEYEGNVRADAPEGDAFCVLKVLLDGDDMDAALDAYEDVLAGEIDDFSSTAEDQKGKLNGMSAVTVTGEGQRDDVDWSVQATLVSTNRSVLLLLIGWEKEKKTTYALLQEKIVNSLKKLK